MHLDRSGEKRSEVAAGQHVHSVPAMSRLARLNLTKATMTDGEGATRVLHLMTARTRVSVTRPVCFPVLENARLILFALYTPQQLSARSGFPVLENARIAPCISWGTH